MEEEVKSQKNWKICSGFILKIIAILAMTIDHIGVMWGSYGLGATAYDIMRMIGRIAMPLYCFMIVEGVIHTKSFKKYILRLSIMAAVISIALVLLTSIKELGFPAVRGFGNIFIDLALGATAVFCLRLKGLKKLFALLPLFFVSLSFTANKLESTQGMLVHWMPYFLRCQYDLMSFSFIIFFYLAYVIKDLFFKIHTSQIGLPEDTFEGSDFERTITNIISVTLFSTIVLLFHFLNIYLTSAYMDVQLYALIAGAFVLLYNGKRGYNSKWFEYGSYVYYPVHIMLIALVFYLMNL